MTPFQESLKRMADVIGVTVFFDVKIDLADGKSLEAQAFFPGFGTKKGTLVFHQFDAFGHVVEDLQGQGYTWSEFGFPDSSWFDPQSLKETLEEWGDLR